MADLDDDTGVKRVRRSEATSIEIDPPASLDPSTPKTPVLENNSLDQDDGPGSSPTPGTNTPSPKPTSATETTQQDAVMEPSAPAAQKENTTDAEIMEEDENDSDDEENDEVEEGLMDEYVDDHAAAQADKEPPADGTNNETEAVKLIAWVPLNANSIDLERMIKEKLPKLKPVKELGMQKGAKSFGKEDKFPDLQAYIYLKPSDVSTFLKRTSDLQWYHLGGETDEIKFNTVTYYKTRYFVRFNSFHRQSDRTDLNTQAIRKWFDKLKVLVSVRYWTVNKKFSIILLEFQSEKQVLAALAKLASMSSVGGDDIKKKYGYMITDKETLAIKLTRKYHARFRHIRQQIHIKKHEYRLRHACKKKLISIASVLTDIDDQQWEDIFVINEQSNIPQQPNIITAQLNNPPERRYTREEKGKQPVYENTMIAVEHSTFEQDWTRACLEIDRAVDANKPGPSHSNDKRLTPWNAINQNITPLQTRQINQPMGIPPTPVNTDPIDTMITPKPIHKKLPYEPTTKIRIVHQNIQSISNPKLARGQALLNLLQNEHEQNRTIDILMLSETWVTQKRHLKYWLQTSTLGRKYEIFSCHEESRNTDSIGQGVAIVISKNLVPYIQQITRISGRLVLLEITRLSETIIVGTVYAPANPGLKENKSTIARIENSIIQHIDQTVTPKRILIAGDWNAVMDPSQDRVLSHNDGEPAKPTSITPETKLLTKLTTKNQTLHKPLIDLWRFIHPDKIEYTHTVPVTGKQHPSRARLDFALASEQMAFSTTDYKHVDFHLDSKLHHQALDIQVELPLSRTNLKYGPTNQNECKIDWQQCTPEHIDTYKNTLTNNPGIQRIQALMIEASANNAAIPQPLLTAAERHLTQKMRQTARCTLPMKTFKPTKQITTTQMPRKHRLKRDKGWHLARLWRATNRTHTSTKNSLDETIINRTALKEHVEQILEDVRVDWNDDTDEQIIEAIKLAIDTEFKTRERKQLRERLAQRETMFAENISRNIKNIMESKTEWDGLTFTKDTDTKRIINEPEEVKADIHKHFNNLRTANKTARTEVTVDWENEYTPIPEINSEWYSTLMTEVTRIELHETIKHLPKGKAPGPSGISYELFQQILDTHTMDYLQILINQIVTHQHTPKYMNMGTIILLPKTDQYTGDKSKLRPITLLEALKKVVTTILNTRLTIILNKHKILKGNNFGFQKGKSTNDNITTLTHLLDMANLENKPLYLSGLDIEKCYDTVPFWAERAACRRIKIPETFIRLMQNMDGHNSITINTPYGTTEPFRPGMGLPQGDALSTTRWLIFYDPLLCRLQTETEGFPIPRTTIRVSAFGYADDLNSLAARAAAMQKQLDMIYEFLDQFDMRMNPAKSLVLCNEAAFSELSNDNKFYLGGIPIRTANAGEMIRVVGAQMTADKSHKKTLDNALQALGMATHLIYKKHTPSKITIYLINSIIIPRLLYKLQCTPLTTTEITKIDVKLRKLARHKTGLQNEISNNTLYDKNYGIGLMNFQNQLDCQTINNAMLHSRSDTLTGIVSREADKVFTNYLKTHKGLLSHPLQSNLKHKYFLPYISSVLERQNMQIRQIQSEYTLDILDMLSVRNYNLYWKALQTAKITTAPELYSKTRGPETWLMSFSQWAKNTGKSKYIEIPTTPLWYQAIITTNCETADLDITRVEQRFQIKRSVLDRINIRHETLTRQHTGDLDIWTDGSLKGTSMGSSAVIVTQNEALNNTDSYNYISKPPPGDESSTRAEIWAIYAALRKCDPTANITINTDSQAAKDSIEKVLHTTVSTRQMMKLKNNSMLIEIAKQVEHYQLIPKIIKVPAHTGLPLNELADRLANASMIMSDNLYQDLDRTCTTSILYHQDTRTDIYPGTKLTKTFRLDTQTTSLESLHKNWDHIPTNEVDWATTIRLTKTGFNRQNRFDTTGFKEQKFRIQQLQKKLPTLSRLKTQQPNKFTHATCPRCKMADETAQHIYTCIHTTKQLGTIRELTLENLKNNHQIGADWAPLANCIDLENPELLLQRLGLMKPNFLISNEAMGLISHNNYDNFTDCHPLILLYTMECYMSAFYKTIWRYRNRKLDKDTKKKTKTAAKAAALPKTKDNQPKLPTILPKIKCIFNPKFENITIKCKLLKLRPKLCKITKKNTNPTRLSVSLTRIIRLGQFPIYTFKKTKALPQTTPRLKLKRKPPEKDPYPNKRMCTYPMDTMEGVE
jgi:ribonuclease HI